MFIMIVLTIIALIGIFLKYLRSLRLSDLDQKHVVISGCDSGFGKELAIKLDLLGFHVHAGCLTTEGQETLTALMSSRLRPFPLDIKNTGSIGQALDDISQQTNNRLWALVNNAGISGTEAPIQMCSVQDFETAMRVNLFGHIAMIKAFLPLIRKSKGRVVNVTSVAGRLACVNGPYCASKFAFEGFSDCLRRELAPLGVKVSIIEPGLFRTAILNGEAIMRSTAYAYEKSSEDVQKAYGTDFLERVKKQHQVMTSMASEERHLVVEAYVEAITAKFPRSRYVVGTRAKFVSIPMTFLPDWLADLALHLIKKSFE